MVYSNIEAITKKRTFVTYGKLQTIEYPSNITGTNRKATVILPPNYTEEKKYPVVYMLHGVGGDEEEWLGASPVELIGNLIHDGMMKEAIAVLPNVRVRKDDKKDTDDIYSLQHYQAFDKIREELLDNIMPYMKEHFSILEGREHTALCGLSMGGRETIYTGFTRPQYFGYLGAFSPAYGILPYDNRGVAENGLVPQDQLKIPAKYPTDITIMNGDHDCIVWSEPERYHKALVENQVDHLYYEVPGDHDFGVWTIGLYNFLCQISAYDAF